MPSSDILRTAVTSWTPGIRPTWTISEVRQALRLHAEGDFSLSAQLVDTMGEDDVLPSTLEKLVDAVLGSDFELRAVDAPNRQLSKVLVNRFGPLWWDMFPESEMDDLLRWYRMLGVGLAVLDWDRGGSQWKAKLRVLHPQFLHRDQYNEKWIYNAREGQLEVTPGDGKWVMLIDGQRGWMKAAVRALAITWISKQLTIRDQNRYNERHGLPIIKANAPAIAEEGDKDQFWEDLKGIQNETVVQLPTHLGGVDAAQEISYDIDLLEAKDQSWKTFETTLDRADRRIMIFMLGSNLSTEVDGQGSRAAAETHRGVEISKATALAVKLATETRWQGLYPVISYNVSSAPIEVTPWPHWDTEPPSDTKAEAEDQKTFGEAIKAVQDAGFDVDNLDELAEKHGLQLSPREMPEPIAPSAPPGQAPDEEDDPDEDDEDDEDTAATGNIRTLAAVKPKGVRNGQGYTDRVRKNASAHASKHLARTIAGLVAAVGRAGSYDEARRLVLEKYRDMAPPTELASLTEAALQMAHLGGALAVREDVPELDNDEG
jgi:phage gp29-like protein